MAFLTVAPLTCDGCAYLSSHLADAEAGAAARSPIAATAARPPTELTTKSVKPSSTYLPIDSSIHIPSFISSC